MGMVILAFWKVVEAFSITVCNDVATLSCWACRSFVPVWIIILLGDPSLSTLSDLSAL